MLLGDQAGRAGSRVSLRCAGVLQARLLQQLLGAGVSCLRLDWSARERKMLNTNHDVGGPLLSTTYLAMNTVTFGTDSNIDYQAAIQTWRYALFSFRQQFASHNRSPDTTAVTYVQLLCCQRLLTRYRL